MPINLKELFSTLENGIVSLAKTSFSGYLNEAVTDGNNMINGLKSNIEEYSLSLAAGEIDEENFKSLIMGEKDLSEMTALTEAGLAAIHIDKFKNDIFSLITTTVTGLIK